ncbi:hypothetical protein BU25DRAFT_492740 [Macroventuria anomochaeta]|uniref:Uncharacterized protein n=1 Tax=Macroventuria anomochaeta TaxID=301207 RepID=A0ACB6RU25_9PLEO|nr:uncharacterized protein BU25DRAFT_492740 [Macroventuria anomochaeta]KAF2625451.1 hypothetical protein BU25DRAFT_492740 [Macroventuria anomochaeta]
MHEVDCERATVSLDLDRRPTQAGKVKNIEEIVSVSRAQLRGGAGQRQAGLFGWLKRDQGVHQKLDKGKDETTSTVVIYKGREIGSPQPVSALNVLPPASRFVKQPDDCPSLNATPKSSLKNDYDVNGNHLPISFRQNHRVFTRPQSPPLPPPPALLATQSRPATTNPFAGIYGNPNIIRAGPASSPIEYAAAGSLVHRPSALDGSQTGYGQASELPRRSPLRDSTAAVKDANDPHDSGVKSTTQKVRADRRWDALPALPSGEGAPEPPPKDEGEEEVEGSDDEPFDTEEVLSSLRPERLSLYHIGTSGRPVHGFADVDHEPVAISSRPPQVIISNTRRPAENYSPGATDNYSVRTREWDLQSCATDDLGLDNRLERQEQLTKRGKERRVPEQQRRQEDLRDNNEPLNGLPEEDAANPESVFYAELIDLVKDYHEQQKIVRRAFEAGEMSEGQWRREMWRHRTALDKNANAAADMSGYIIFTDENDIKRAIEQPTGYAIYSSLLKIRDPETWERIFEPALVNPQPSSVANALQQHVVVRENSLMWLVRKAGRALRFMLAVPDDPTLKTYSSRHPPLTDVVTYQSQVGVLGPNIPLRPQHIDRFTTSEPIPTSLRQNFAPARNQPGPSTQVERPPKISNDTTRVNKNTLSTGVTLASPLNGRHVRAPRSRGYEQDAFVTVLNPSVVSSATEKTMAGYGAGMPGKRYKARDQESKVTAWPEADC